MCSGIIPDHESEHLDSSFGSCIYCCVASREALNLSKSPVSQLHSGDSNIPPSSL